MIIRPGFVLLAATLAACQPADQPGNSALSDEGVEGPSISWALCHADVLPIGEVQGPGFRSPLEGQGATVRGVVNHIVKNQGLFIQEEHPTRIGLVSNGIFVESSFLADSLNVGELLAVSGLVQEIGEGVDTLTAIGQVSEYSNCGEGAEPPDMGAHLPLSRAERETVEGMHLFIDQPLTVTAVRDVSRGKIVVSAPGILQAPTEVNLPGEAAAAHQQKNRDSSLVIHDNALSRLEPYTRIHAGALIHRLTGVLGHDGDQPVLLPSDEIQHEPLPVPEIEPAAQGVIRVASFNLYEYFNGDGQGEGFPGERGADTEDEFVRQAASIAAAIEQIQPDLLGVMELENDGFGPKSAINSLRRSVSETLDTEFAVARPQSDRVGTDVINVGLLYRTDRLEAVGPAVVLEGNSFGPLNRVPIAQTLLDRSSGEKFVVVVNHLKSKGYCPDSGADVDHGDGQACWNATRTEGARKTVEWARSLATRAGTDKILLVGDFNAYRLEDPVRAIEESGLSELVAHHNPGIPQYSYIYRGAAGTLDYAFASEPLASISTGAMIWHINAPYPYSTRPSEAYLRSSDHDPVVVDLLFSQSETSD